MANRSKLFWVSLSVGLLGGICGVLVDLDHFPLFGEPGREAHISIGVIASLVFSVSLACIGGLLVRHLLKRRSVV